MNLEWAWKDGWSWAQEKVLHVEKVLEEKKKFAWIDCVLLSFHFTCKIPSTFALAVFLSFYFSTCTSTSLFFLPLLSSQSLSVTHSISFARGVCIFPNAVVHRRSYSRSSLFWYDLHIPPITSPLVYITILCNAPSFLHRTCRACTWTCNDKFYWKVSLTRIFISSSSFTVAIANNLPSIWWKLNEMK